MTSINGMKTLTLIIKKYHDVFSKLSDVIELNSINLFYIVVGKTEHYAFYDYRV